MADYLIILTAAVTSYLLKLIPVIIFKRAELPDNSSVLKFFNYAAYAVIGGIIYITALGGMNRSGALVFNAVNVFKLIIIFTAFFITCRSKNILINFCVCLLIYAVLFYLFFTG